LNALTYLLVALGGAIGSVSRAWVSVTVVRLVGPNFPWSTMLVNVVGSAFIGIVAASALSPTRTLVTQEVRVFLMVGFCGGFTTFSSFSLSCSASWRRRRATSAPPRYSRGKACQGLARSSPTSRKVRATCIAADGLKSAS
jgi:protein CrcB